MVQQGPKGFVGGNNLAIKKGHHHVFLAIRSEEFGAKPRPPEVCTPFDLLEMLHADCVIALPEESYGVHIELGWASALNKPIILLLKQDQTMTSPLLAGLPAISRCRVLHLPHNILTTKDAQKDLALQVLATLSSMSPCKRPARGLPQDGLFSPLNLILRLS